MPLAQNYKDDVSLLESEAALRKPKIQIITTPFASCQETSVSNYLVSICQTIFEGILTRKGPSSLFK